MDKLIPTKQIKIQRWVAPKDANGNAKEGIAESYHIWATPVNNGGGRTDHAGQTILNNRVTFKIYFRADWQINSAWKIIYLGQTFTITNISRIDEKRFNWIIDGEN
jgi:SPP1 family predicted phage head-tail adaptor